MEPSLELSVWLGLAGTALVGANLILWRTRHTLRKLRQDLAVPDGRLMPATVTELATSVTTELTTSVKGELATSVNAA